VLGVQSLQLLEYNVGVDVVALQVSLEMRLAQPTALRPGPAHVQTCARCVSEKQPRREQVRALAGVSRSALRCHSNETRAPIANPPNSAQL